MTGVESMFPDNGLVNLSQVVEIKKIGLTKMNIKFSVKNNDFVCWEYPDMIERDKEYIFLKEIISPRKRGIYHV